MVTDNEWNLRLVVLWLRLAANVFSPRPEGLTYRDEHFLHSRTPQDEIFRKKVKYFLNGRQIQILFQSTS